MKSKGKVVNNGKQGGFTLVELMIALAIMVIIGTILWTSVNMNKSKGQIAYVAATNIAKSAERFQVDTSCYPFTTQQLFANPGNSTSNSCGVAIGTTWNGPYMNAEPVNSSGDILLPKIGPTTSISIQSGNWINMAGVTTEYAVILNNVPTAIAKQALTACTNNANSATSGSNTVSGNCFIGTPSGGLNTFGYVFASQ